MKFNFKTACYYDVTYKKTIFNRWNKNKDFIEITLNKLMFWYSTNCYYVFWTGSSMVCIKKDLVISVNEL